MALPLQTHLFPFHCSRINQIFPNRIGTNTVIDIISYQNSFCKSPEWLCKSMITWHKSPTKARHRRCTFKPFYVVAGFGMILLLSEILCLSRLVRPIGLFTYTHRHNIHLWYIIYIYLSVGSPVLWAPRIVWLIDWLIGWLIDWKIGQITCSKIKKPQSWALSSQPGEDFTDVRCFLFQTGLLQ